MNINHMSLLTIHTQKLLVTIIASLGVCNRMNINHMSLQTVLTVKLFITFFARLVVDSITLFFQHFGTSVGVAIGRCSGGRLATTLVDRYFHHSFLFFFLFSSPSSTFLIE